MGLPQRPPPSGPDPALTEIQADFPAWQCWKGISGLVYGRRRNSSPPIVIRDENTVELRARIKVAEDAISARSLGHTGG